MSSSTWHLFIFAMRAWSWQSGSLFVMVAVGVRLELLGGVSLLSLDRVLAICAGGHRGSFTTTPRWAPNVLVKIWGRSDVRVDHC